MSTSSAVYICPDEKAWAVKKTYVRVNQFSDLKAKNQSNGFNSTNVPGYCLPKYSWNTIMSLES